MSEPLYSYTVPGASHWSFRIRRGLQLTLTDLEGGANVGMLFYNPDDLLERYNAPDTLKCQHTFKLTQGHCLYSDMGRIFCSITADSAGWHDTVCANSTAASIARRYGERDYQTDRNTWHQNGYDAFQVELSKYGLGPRDMAANLNLFSRVSTDADGNLQLAPPAATGGSSVTLRFEMDTLVLLHTCPHPLYSGSTYPFKPVLVQIDTAPPIEPEDQCLNHCAENQRGFENNHLYHLGATPGPTAGKRG